MLSVDQTLLARCKCPERVVAGQIHGDDEDRTLGGHAMQCTDDVPQNCTPASGVVLLSNDTPTN